MITPETRIIDLSVAQLTEIITKANQNLRPAQQEVDPEPDIIEIDEACKITHLARQTIYQLCCKGSSVKKEGNKPLPFIKREGSKKLLFSRKALQKWVEGKSINQNQ